MKADALGTVLVPLDGSVSTEIALETAAALAERVGATLHLAAVVRSDEAKLDLGSGVAVTQPGSPEYAPVLDEYVARVVEAASERFGCPVEATVITAEDPSQGLTEYERRHGVGLTVMGVPVPVRTPGRGLSAAVVREAPSPVLFLPAVEGGNGPQSALTPPSRLVGIITATVSEREAAVRCGVGYARLWGAGARLIPGSSMSGVSGGEEQRRHLERVAAELSEDGSGVEVCELGLVRSPGDLIAALRRERIDTVVTGPAHKSLAEVLLFGAHPGHEAAGDDDLAGQVAVLVCPS